jgi:hypothetical protein
MNDAFVRMNAAFVRTSDAFVLTSAEPSHHRGRGEHRGTKICVFLPAGFSYAFEPLRLRLSRQDRQHLDLLRMRCIVAFCTLPGFQRAAVWIWPEPNQGTGDRLQVRRNIRAMEKPAGSGLFAHFFYCFQNSGPEGWEARRFVRWDGTKVIGKKGGKAGVRSRPLASPGMLGDRTREGANAPAFFFVFWHE